MLDFHTDKQRYFEMQYLTSKESIVPLVEDICELNNNTKVLEIGCAEGGVLKAFLEKGCKCTGIELSENRTKSAKKFLNDYYISKQINFVNENIYNINKDDIGQYDIIILKDVIEHIPEQEKLLGVISKFLSPKGLLFIAFPPWYMPFGGHQQVSKSKLISRIPYIHLNPMFLYKIILNIFNKKGKNQNAELIEIKETGISIKRFKKIAKRNNLDIEKEIFYFIPPIYKHKFGKKTRISNKFISSIPFLREFFIFSSYFVLKKSQNK